MNWLMLSWALTTGYLPVNSVILMDTPKGNYYLIKDDSYFVKFELSAEALGHVRAWGSMETFAGYAGPDAGMGGWFKPFEDKYRVGLALFAKGIEVGGEHECDHGVLSSSRPGAWLGGSCTKLYVRISGGTGQ